MANPAYPRWRDWRKCVGGNGENYIDANTLSAEVEALQSIKGCGFALAAAFASEVGDFSRFRSGRQVTSYFGLAPSQRSSADSVRLGGISGAGNALVRRLAVEGS